MAPGGGDFQRAAGDFLALDLAQIGAAGFLLHFARFGRREDLDALQVIEQRDEIGRGEDRNAAGPAGFGPLRGGAGKTLVRPAGVERGEEDAGGSDDATIERELPHGDPVAQLFGIGDAHGGEQGQRDGQIIVRAFLGKVRRGEVDRDPLGRQREAERGERCLDALFAFIDRLVRQADEVKPRHAGGDLALHFNRAGFEPEIGDCFHSRDHAPCLRC